MAQQVLDQFSYSYQDYLMWSENEPCELIDGRLVSMAPAPDLDYQTVVVELSTQIALQLRDKQYRATRYFGSL